MRGSDAKAGDACGWAVRLLILFLVPIRGRLDGLRMSRGIRLRLPATSANLGLEVRCRWAGHGALSDR